ncbi:lmo0937 family membrane protein [Allorhodopirellula heiligendammensis]|uniref:Lmo0937 family membrane protein n=1 Tax=Allorhodopirellula heiligendammensis TaxID=2714739 RepID=A0A5C6BV81_9BACT|nr:lmo0937 family membrane protein [Allorhodopirellula heiligendammensis]TWU15557.1 hypothetical protein Poly21_27540 [Allorhodopirellula heiligendammensis]|tara:strand:- start:33 stop:182 length:150 start_codon:yes stop_codon:yes gene_type:complete
MLWSLIGILIVIWVIAFLAKATAGGLIHLLLIVAVIMLAYRLITGRNIT